MKKTTLIPAGAAIAGAILAGCTPTIKTQNEVTVKPIQVTIDVNLKVDEELNQSLASDAQNKTDQVSKDMRERRRARRAKIKEWKTEKLIGENNRGLLEARTPDGKLSVPVQEAVAAENAERQQVFQTIATKRSLSADAVGERWAKRMAERAEKGMLYQDAKGNWQEK